MVDLSTDVVILVFAGYVDGHAAEYRVAVPYGSTVQIGGAEILMDQNKVVFWDADWSLNGRAQASPKLERLRTGTSPIPPASSAPVTATATTRVCIDTSGPTITIEADQPLGVVLNAALRAFHEARQHYPPTSPRSAEPVHTTVGFHGERRDTETVQPSSMYWAPGPYPIQPPGGPA